MVETPDRRRVARLAVPLHLGGLELELGPGRLLDLSTEGARIERPGRLHEGLVLYIDLPPALGGGRLTGKVVWTRLRKGEQTLEGDKQIYYYQSGLAFVEITPEQQAALAAALAILKRDERAAGE
ncbi:MAG TPA: PilZ domain-containing protein [Candidatus Methylomirabilis sp.]|nr:PilZ domain-containing protein [Candidatus Methylomirabilis sp.]